MASPIACVEVVQAVATARLGPVILKTMDKCPPTKLMMLAGIKNGDTFFGECVLHITVVGLFDGFQAAHSRSHHDPDALRIGLGHLKPGIAHGLNARHHAVLHEGVHAARILRRHVGFQIQLSDFAAEVGREIGGVEPLYRSDAAASGQDIGPRRRDVIADGRDDPKTCNDDASFAHCPTIL